MRVLRSSLYMEMGQPPLTTVVRDSDVTVPLEEMALGSPHPGALLMHDIFDMPEGGIEEATAKAMNRFNEEEERERNMAILFHWALRHFRILRPNGVLLMDKPAPLRVEDMEYVFKQLKEEPSYNRFRITGFSHDNRMVRLHNGEVDVE